MREQIEAALADAKAREVAATTQQQALHQQMQATLQELNAQGVKLEQDLFGVAGEVKALEALLKGLADG